jgi:hypothetical protein
MVVTESKPAARRPFSAKTMNRVLDMSNGTYYAIIKKQQVLEAKREEQKHLPRGWAWFWYKPGAKGQR